MNLPNPELDMVVLTHNVEECRLKWGDMGAVVHRYHGGAALEVEFVTAEGETVAVLTLAEADVRPIASRGNTARSGARPGCCLNAAQGLNRRCGGIQHG